MNFHYSGIFVFDLPSILPKFTFKEIDKKINFLGLVFNWEMEEEEEKFFNEAKNRGFPCFRIENLSSTQSCANIAYNLNRIGEFVYLWTNDITLLQMIGPRTYVYYYKKYKIYDYYETILDFDIDPWKLPDLFSLLGVEEKGIKGIMGVEEDRILKWIRYFSSAEELLARLDLLEVVEEERPFYYQNLIKKQEKKILDNLKKLKLTPSFFMSLKKELFSIKKKSKII